MTKIVPRPPQELPGKFKVTLADLLRAREKQKKEPKKP